MIINLTKVLSIRSFAANDYVALAKYADNPKVAINLRDAFPNPYSEFDAKEWIELATGSNPQTHFAITHNDMCIGCIGLTLQEDIFQHSAEIGFWLGEEFWGNGITTLATSALIEYAFSKLNLDRVFAIVYSNNKSSIRVLEKCSLQYEGRMVRGAIKHGNYIDLLQYAILKDENSNEK